MDNGEVVTPKSAPKDNEYKKIKMVSKKTNSSDSESESDEGSELVNRKVREIFEVGRVF